MQARNIPLIEDVCESHGATFKGRKLGTFGLMSNFSFYYAHHMSTIEGGMICTNDADLYESLAHAPLPRHGARSRAPRRSSAATVKQHPDLNPDFIFAFPAYNVRSTEINAVLGRAQLKRLDQNNERRRANLRLFLDHLDPQKYRTDFEVEGSCNYAFTLILRAARPGLPRPNVEQRLREAKVEFRRGTSGGGNQLRQPYVRKLLGERDFERYPKVDHVHFYGYYIGNYPELEREQDPGSLRSAEPDRVTRFRQPNEPTA